MAENQLGALLSPEQIAARTKANESFLESINLQFVEGRGLLTKGGDSDRQRDRMVKERWDQLYRVGWEQATVINCLPWALEIHTTFGYFRIPAPDKKKNEAFHTFQIRVPSIDMRDLGEAKYVPEVVMPIEIAQEFEKKYKEEGGVIVFRTPRDRDLPENVGELLQAAQERMTAWYKHKFQDGQKEWARSRQNPQYIDDRHRDAARFLFEKSLIAQLPDWISTTRDEATQKECPACGEIVKKTAKICVHCRFHIDPDFVNSNRERLGIAEEEETKKPTKKANN